MFFGQNKQIEQVGLLTLAISWTIYTNNLGRKRTAHQFQIVSYFLTKEAAQLPFR